MAPINCNACICCYVAIDPDDIKILLKERNECLCLVSDCCLAVGDDGYGIGLITDSSKGEICKLGLMVCACGLKKPDTLCSGAGHCLCIKRAQAFPFESEYVAEPLCAICFIQLMPDVGIAKEAPSLPSMVR
jgi:hypothetical protein